MDEMIGYVFNSLKSSETSIKRIRKALNRQVRFNKTVTILAVVISVYMITEKIQVCEQNRKIEELTNKIEEIKKQ